MNNKKILFCIFIIFFSISVITAKSHAKGNEMKHVLVLNSYNCGYVWSDGISDGIKSELGKDGNIEMYFEYMDVKRISNDEYFQMLYNLYKYKYKNKTIDAIIISDNDAFNFIKKYKDSLFPNVPVVFCGVNNYEDSMLSGMTKITGVVEVSDIQKTIDIAFKFHPNTRQVIAIVGKNTTGDELKKSFINIIKKYNDKNLIIIQESIEDTVKQQLQSVSKDNNTIIFYSGNYNDSSGQSITPEKACDFILSGCNLPIYSTWDFFINHRIIGGLMTSSNFQGTAAAQVAKRILNGEDISNIPVIKSNTNKYMFDYNKLKFYTSLIRIKNSSNHFYCCSLSCSIWS